MKKEYDGLITLRFFVLSLLTRKIIYFQCVILLQVAESYFQSAYGFLYF